MKLWKVLGIAGLAGVAATGVIMARDQRQRAQLEPEEIRNRLQQRLEQAQSVDRAPSVDRAQSVDQAQSVDRAQSTRPPAPPQA